MQGVNLSALLAQSVSAFQAQTVSELMLFNKQTALKHFQFHSIHDNLKKTNTDYQHFQFIYTRCFDSVDHIGKYARIYFEQESFLKALLMRIKFFFIKRK